MIVLSERTLYEEYIYPESSKYSDYEYFYKNFFHDPFNLHDNYRHPVKKNVTSEQMLLRFWISHQMIPSMPWWYDEKISKIHPQNQKLRFFNGKFLVGFRDFQEVSLIFSIGKFLTSIFCIFLSRIELYTKN